MKKLSLAQKKGIAGVCFSLPLIFGMVVLFILPLVESLRFAFSNLELVERGFTLNFTGFENFHEALRVNPSFNRYLVEAITGLAVDVPVIVILSLFFAAILNQAFKGRTLARAIFFLPVILAAGAIARMEGDDFLQNVLRDYSPSGGGVLQAFELEQLLLTSGVDAGVVEYLTDSVNRIYQIIGMMGVQLLIFMAGLQSIPSSLYEVSKVEGATGYETFWMITFPMVSPLILTNVIYTVIDSFTNNGLSFFIIDTAFRRLNFGLSSAMSWIYFACISLILFILAKLISRRVFYYDAVK